MRFWWLALPLGLGAAAALAEILARIYVAWSGIVVVQNDDSQWPRSFTDHTAAYVQTYSMVEGGTRLTCGKSADSAPYRLAVIGDSFAYGAGVPDCSDFSSLVNVALPAVGVRNLGRPGAGIDEYLAMTEKRVCKADFDGVLLLICGNDFLDADKGFIKRAAPFSRLAGLSSALVDRAAPNHWALRFMSKLGLVGPRPPGTPLALTYEQITVPSPQGGQRLLVKLLDDLSISREFALHVSLPPKEFLERNLALFEKLLARARECSRDVYVAVVPNGAAYSEKQREFISANQGMLPPLGEPSLVEEKVRELSVAYGAHFIETDASFAPEADEAYYANDIHWTAVGHRIMAGRLLNALATRPQP